MKVLLAVAFGGAFATMSWAGYAMYDRHSPPIVASLPARPTVIPTERRSGTILYQGAFTCERLAKGPNDCWCIFRLVSTKAVALTSTRMNCDQIPGEWRK